MQSRLGERCEPGFAEIVTLPQFATICIVQAPFICIHIIYAFCVSEFKDYLLKIQSGCRRSALPVKEILGDFSMNWQYTGHCELHYSFVGQH